MANPLPLPVFDANGHAPAQDTDEPTDSGALIRWEKADGTASGNLGLLGVRTVVLCLVMCLGRVIQDGELPSLDETLRVQSLAAYHLGSRR